MGFIKARLDRQAIGKAAEEAAVCFLRAHGFVIVLRNFRRRLGELDIVARAGSLLVIAEVRTRSGLSYGGAAASVGSLKQRRILRASVQLLQQRADLARLRVRFDVLVVHDACGAQPRIEWIQHAFGA
ncbi:MAG TPA: YraN family protein [Steroidobacteraceae bacterium]|jgi:putative endonuclease